MKRTKVLDAYALLAYLKGESGSGPVVKALEEAEKGRLRAVINEINLGEVYYILAKERSLADARAFIDDILPQLPLAAVSNRFDDIIAAAELKAGYSISYADAFAALTAIRESAPLLTGDPDFSRLQDRLKVEWLSD